MPGGVGQPGAVGEKVSPHLGGQRTVWVSVWVLGLGRAARTTQHLAASALLLFSPRVSQAKREIPEPQGSPDHP